MDTRAGQVKDRARQRMIGLSQRLGTQRALLGALHEHGVSPHWAAKFYNGHRDNPLCSQLDKLLDALDTIEAQQG